MANALVELFFVIAGVILAPFIAQGLFKPSTPTGKVAASLAGIGLVITFLTVWSIYQKDPLQIVFCTISSAVLPRPLPACAPPPVPPPTGPVVVAPPLNELFHNWRRPDDAECREPLVIRRRPPYIEVLRDGLIFTESIEGDANNGSFKAVVIKPESVRRQRFVFRLLDKARVLEITPIFGGATELWYQCAIQPQ